MGKFHSGVTKFFTSFVPFLELNGTFHSSCSDNCRCYSSKSPQNVKKDRAEKTGGLTHAGKQAESHQAVTWMKNKNMEKELKISHWINCSFTSAIDLLICGLFLWLICRSSARLIVWLMDRSIHRMIDWLIDWHTLHFVWEFLRSTIFFCLTKY